MRLLLLILSLVFVGCASNTKQTDAFYQNPLQIKPVVQNKAPFINQDIGHCGPAVLTMAIQSTGTPASLTTITQQVYTPGATGSLQNDLISSARRQGMTAIPIKGLQAMLQEIEAGHNVIAFENLGISWIPQWHYALITGYNLSDKTLRMHSGPNAHQIMSMQEFELSWKLADYWALVVLKPEALSATGSELDHLTAASALEQIENFTAAEKAYLAVLKKWPTSLVAYIGLGNISYQQKKFSQSVQYLSEGLKHHPNSDMIKNNLAVAKNALKTEKRQ